MENREIACRLQQMAVNTGTLNCLGCGYEHNCSLHGCAICREAAGRIGQLAAENAVLRETTPTRWPLVPAESGP